MIMESITIDFRCRDCSTVRRVDANPSCSIAAHLPQGWGLYAQGSTASTTVLCPNCYPSVEVPEDDEGYVKAATEALYRSADPKWQGNKIAAEAAEEGKKARADERREAIKDVHLSAASTTDPEAQPFSARGRESGDLTPPTTQAPVPVFNEICPLCNTAITEGQAWQPDPMSALYVRVHKVCLRKRAETHSVNENDGE